MPSRSRPSSHVRVTRIRPGTRTKTQRRAHPHGVVPRKVVPACWRRTSRSSGPGRPDCPSPTGWPVPAAGAGRRPSPWWRRPRTAAATAPHLVLLGGGPRPLRRRRHRVLAAAAGPRPGRPPHPRGHRAAALQDDPLRRLRVPGRPRPGGPRRGAARRGHRRRRRRTCPGSAGAAARRRRERPRRTRPLGVRLPPARQPARGPHHAAPALPRLVRAHRPARLRPRHRRADGLPHPAARRRPVLRLRPAPLGRHDALVEYTEFSPAPHPRRLRGRRTPLHRRRAPAGRPRGAVHRDGRHPDDRRGDAPPDRPVRVPHRRGGRRHPPLHRLHLRRPPAPDPRRRRRPPPGRRPEPPPAHSARSRAMDAVLLRALAAGVPTDPPCSAVCSTASPCGGCCGSSTATPACTRTSPSACTRRSARCSAPPSNCPACPAAPTKVPDPLSCPAPATPETP